MKSVGMHVVEVGFFLPFRLIVDGWPPGQMACHQDLAITVRVICLFYFVLIF